MHLYNLGKLCFFIDKIKNKTLYFIPIKQNHYNYLQSRFQLTNYNNSRCVYQLSHSIFLFLDHKVAAFGVCVRDYKSNLAGKKLGLCSNALIKTKELDTMPLSESSGSLLDLRI